MEWFEAKAQIDRLTNGQTITSLEERELIVWIERTNLTNAQRVVAAFQKSKQS